MKIKNEVRRLIGAMSRIKGSSGEKKFVLLCRKENLLFFRIEDGGRPCRGVPNGFIRKAQVCDFILSVNGHFWLIDAKSRANNSRSVFFPALCQKKLTSTQNQTRNFIRAYKNGNPRCGFFIEKDAGPPFYFIPAVDLVSYGEESKAKVVLKKIDKLSDIEYFL